MTPALIATVWALAAPCSLASQDANGVVSVWDPGRSEPVEVSSCPRPAALVWVGEALYIGCPDAAVARWLPGERRARAVPNATLQAIDWSVMAGGSALYLADGESLWRYRPGYDLIEKVAPLPAAIAEIRESGEGIVVTGAAMWLWRARSWSVIRRKNDTS